MTESRKRLVTVEHLSVEVKRPRASSRVILQDVSFSIDAGQSLGLVGESGSGKSMTARAMMRLLPPGATAGGRLDYGDRPVASMSRRELRSYRSACVSMIHQDPRANTNPLRTVGDFITEGVRATGQMTRSEADDRAVALLEEVGIADPGGRMRQYPHQLSGGLLQRMMIVMALMPSPELIIADEPTTALDATVQREVMMILDEQRTNRQLGMLFISHDLDLTAAMTDNLAVMYAGVIVEQGPTSSVYSRPRHPYTAGLLASRPSLTEVGRPLAIPGRPVAAFEAGPGCVFQSRCAFAESRCALERPTLRTVDGRSVACHFAEELADRLQPKALV